MSTHIEQGRTVQDRSAQAPAGTDDRTLRTANFNPPRRRWPGFLITGVMAAGLGALAVSSFYDKRSVGAACSVELVGELLGDELAGLADVELHD